MAQAPAHDAPRMPVHHGGHVAPLAGHLQVRHVSYPHLVGRVRLGRVWPVGHAGEEGTLHHLGVPVQPGTAALQAGQAHQSGNAAPAHGHPIQAKLAGHPRAAIEAAAALVDLAHLLEQLRVLPRSLAGLPGCQA